ncbi:hypothetical protein JOC86_001552 [Bacillus pakistanensis]|uniref:Uncharacterized protein n=1 Tax=Rossellomorea pakistanensis TaxID=992288 RepID=A0ABS2NB28_9BACI|nr:hypothetical protein [Bacillus pakistanensis]MBM7585015.1 hypothetical protein [Bacillus pakistanensis]
MSDQEFLIDLDAYRKKKLQLAIAQGMNLYNESLEFLNREVNIREKVRAKMLFQEKFHIAVDKELTSTKIKDTFQHWLLFDYKTIKGQSIFYQFLHLKASEASEPTRLLGALFLTAPWQPVKLIDLSEEYLVVRSLFNDENLHVVNKSFKQNNEHDPYLFIRSIPIQLNQLLLGPAYWVKEKSLMNDLLDDYKRVENSENTWRSFLKENAVHYILKTL